MEQRDRDLLGLRVVVTAGGTEEPIDPVRVITNRSSGKITILHRSGEAVALPMLSKLEAAHRVLDVVLGEMAVL